MKITKSRLLQIIREEVELHEKNLEENVYELDEETLDDAASEEEADVDGDGNVSRAEANAVFNAEAAKDEENPPNKLMIKLIEEKDDKRVVKDTYKGKTYKTSKSIAKAMKGKKHPRTAAAKAASSWAKDRYAVAQAAKIATTGTAKSKKKKKTEEDRLFGPKDSKGKRPIIQPEKNGGKIEKKQDDI